MRNVLKITLFAAATLLGASSSWANLITNGDFELGSLAGWATVHTGGNSNSFYLISNGASVPVSGQPTQVNPGGGNYVAVSDQSEKGGEVLLQSFITPGGSLKLTFDWFDNDHGLQFGTEINGNQETGRVDILYNGASAFDVGSGVAQNLLLGAGTVTGDLISIPWQSATDTITGLAAGTYQLRFGNGQCCVHQEFGVDNVVLTASDIPEPATLLLLGTGLFGLGPDALAESRVAARLPQDGRKFQGYPSLGQEPFSRYAGPYEFV